MGNIAHHALLLSEEQARKTLVKVIAGLVHNGVKIKFKTKENKPQGWLNKLISVVLFFNKDYLTKYTTVIGKTIWFPSEEYYRELYDKRPASLLATLLHERRHIEQSEENNVVVHSLLYLFPQILALGALAAPLSPWFLLSLVFLLPLPSPYRVWAEKQGYRITTAVMYWASGYPPNTYSFAKQFAGPGYYYMAPPWTVEKYMDLFQEYHEAHERSVWDDGKELPPYLRSVFLLFKQTKAEQKPRGAV